MTLADLERMTEDELLELEHRLIARYDLRAAVIVNRIRREKIKGGNKEMMRRRTRTYIWAYLDGKPLVEVIQAALDNNMTVDDLKQRLIEENPGHEVTFKLIRK